MQPGHDSLFESRSRTPAPSQGATRDNRRHRVRDRRRRLLRLAGAAIVLGLCAQFALARGAHAEPAMTGSATGSAISQVDFAWRQGDVAALETLAKRLGLESSKGLQAKPAFRSRYEHAFALLRLAQLRRDGGPRTAYHRAAIEKAQSIAEGLVEDPDAAESERVESLVLLSSIVGLQADGSLFSRMRLGRKAHQYVGRARKLDPDHARARLQLGILLFHTPSTFGGGPESALLHLEQARGELDTARSNELAQAAAATSWPEWGWDDASIWTGQSLAALGRTEQARRVYLETLEREPDMRWVRNDLLPALDAN